ncbi:MAG: hypothetical protein RKO25_10395 [Candidatus Contendobacter sp.]|nr:hypothetical protein [Candidatus Contendobacter sp.]
MTNYAITVEAGYINLSPTLFHRYARDYLACERTFRAVSEYSPVPYFLVCRAIELEFKARHLESKSRSEVKKEFGHDLKKSYDALPHSAKVLDSSEYAELVRASEIYNVPNKGFEYVSVSDAVTRLRSFPSLTVLEAIASKVIDP